jgi:hypothetical protein
MAQVKIEQEMFPLVEGWLSSGLTQKQFCATHQMPVHILAYWVGRYRKAQPAKASANKTVTTPSRATKEVMATEGSSGFIRLSSLPTIPTSAPTPATSSLPTTQLPPGGMEVVLPTGAVIRFSATVPAGYLKELLSVCSH